jgi:hypothetical protein
MLLREFGGHPIKLLLAARVGEPGVAEQPVGDAAPHGIEFFDHWTAELKVACNLRVIGE